MKETYISVGGTLEKMLVYVWGIRKSFLEETMHKLKPYIKKKQKSGVMRWQGCCDKEYRRKDLSESLEVWSVQDNGSQLKQFKYNQRIECGRIGSLVEVRKKAGKLRNKTTDHIMFFKLPQWLIMEEVPVAQAVN